MEKDEFIQLAEKISNGTATDKEVALYNYHYNQSQQELEWDEKHLGSEEQTSQELQSRIFQHIYEEQPARRNVFPYLRVAASIAIIVVSAFFFFKTDKEVPKTLARQDTRLGENINPVNKQAILTLSDGTQVSLDESRNGTLANQGDVKINKLANGEIVYEDSNTDGSQSGNLLNVISIPKGGHYQLTLPDGTKVWLNALSTLKFPAHFYGDQRVVELEGEAYFEVTKTYIKKGSHAKRMPFIVKTSTQNIEVLGTHFNVNAYKNEGSVKTTLLEGSVKVSSAKPGSSKILKPLQQSSLAAGGGISLTDDIDIEEVMGWKNELFYFNNTDLQTIMRQLSRWYDVEVDLAGMPNKKFNGVLSRNVKLSTVLRMMEKTSSLKFQVDERRITMSK